MPLTADELAEIQKLLQYRVDDAPPNASVTDENRLIARLEETQLEMLCADREDADPHGSREWDNPQEGQG